VPPTLLAAAEGLDGPVVVRGGETQAVEDVFDAMIDVVGIVMPQQLVEPVVALYEALALRVILGVR
jgi:hypothetical protein